MSTDVAQNNRNEVQTNAKEKTISQSKRDRD